MRRTVFWTRDIKKVKFFWKSKIVNFYFINAKFYTLIHTVTPIRNIKLYNDPTKVTYVSMATNIPIMKHRPVFESLTFYISVNNEDMTLKLLQNTYVLKLLK